MRRAVAGWVFVPIACLAVLVCLLYLQSNDGSVDRTALLHGSSHNTHADPEALLKKFSSDLKEVAHADQALHAIAAASLPANQVHSIVAQRNSAEAAPASISVEAGPAALRRNRPGVAQHFVQLARQWVARVEPLQKRLAPLQRELAVYDQSVGLVKQHLAQAESERSSLLAVIKSSRDSVASAQRLLDHAHADKLELQRKMVHVANQISAASAAFEAAKAAAADSALKYSLSQERVDPTPEDELAKQIAGGRSTAAVAAAPVPDSHARDLAVINSAIDSREVKHAQLDEYSEEPDDQPFRSSWQPMK